MTCHNLTRPIGQMCLRCYHQKLKKTQMRCILTLYTPSFYFENKVNGHLISHLHLNMDFNAHYSTENKLSVASKWQQWKQLIMAALFPQLQMAAPLYCANNYHKWQHSYNVTSFPWVLGILSVDGNANTKLYTSLEATQDTCWPNEVHFGDNFPGKQ